MLPESCVLSQLVNTDTLIRKQIRDALIPDQVQGANDNKVILVLVKPGCNCLSPAAVTISHQRVAEFRLFPDGTEQTFFQVLVSP